ncbi:MAG: hypothetical protein ABRQ23_00140 [Syntrophomonadaceae bacterium]
MEIRRFSREIIKDLEHYVYLYIDPDTDEIFYVGRGKGNRAFNHLKGKSKNRKNEKISEIRKRGKQPKIEILVHGLDEMGAAKVEASVIDLIGIDKLTNEKLGYESGTYGRLTLEQLVHRYTIEQARIKEPAILFRINKSFRYGMSPNELYDATRGVWALRKKRNQAKLAFAVYEGIIQEVYTIISWHEAGQTFSTRNDTKREGKWEFIGNIAPDNIRDKYIYKSVRNYFKDKGANPVKYINIDK